MAIELSVINFIVPMEIIKQKYPGGLEQCFMDHGGAYGGRIWHDEYLFRDGAMNPIDMYLIFEKWKKLGFRTHKGGKNPKWIDVCVVCTGWDEPTLPCDWIETDGYIAYMKNKPVGEIIGPASYFS